MAYYFISGSIVSTVLLGIFGYLLFIVIRYYVKYERMRRFYDGLPGYAPEQKHWLRGHLHMVSQCITITGACPILKH